MFTTARNFGHTFKKALSDYKCKHTCQLVMNRMLSKCDINCDVISISILFNFVITVVIIINYYLLYYYYYYYYYY